MTPRQAVCHTSVRENPVDDNVFTACKYGRTFCQGSRTLQPHLAAELHDAAPTIPGTAGHLASAPVCEPDQQPHQVYANVQESGGDDQGSAGRVHTVEGVSGTPRSRAFLTLRIRPSVGSEPFDCAQGRRRACRSTPYVVEWLTTRAMPGSPSLPPSGSTLATGHVINPATVSGAASAGLCRVA